MPLSLGIEHRGEVLFGTRQGSDLCHVEGRQTIFERSDPIYYAAVMRETLPRGARLVLELDVDGVTVGPFPVEVDPPLDCIGTARSIAPLGSGTYVIRFRDDSRPGSPDLATGTFTVR